MAEKAGIPAGVVNIVTGDAPAIGEEMCENPTLRKITFTGSTRVGKLLAANAGKNMKKISMELGGNAPFIVFDDADLDRAVEGAIASSSATPARPVSAPTGSTCRPVSTMPSPPS
jgi:succinate-semialdehyde dehydrogenase/glutarate-semialdehyde dehydrogenase